MTLEGALDGPVPADEGAEEVGMWACEPCARG